MRHIKHIYQLINKVCNVQIKPVSILVWHVLKCWYVLTAGHYHDVLKIGNVT